MCQTVRMAIARIVAMTLALLPAMLAAQQVQQTPLTIRVTDQTGAVIPGARIQIDPSPGSRKVDTATDRIGEAIVELSPGSHVLSIAAYGFKKWIENIDVQDQPGQSIVAELKVASGDPVVIFETPYMPLDRIPIDISITLHIPEILILPGRPISTHRTHKSHTKNQVHN